MIFAFNRWDIYAVNEKDRDYLQFGGWNSKLMSHSIDNCSKPCSNTVDISDITTVPRKTRRKQESSRFIHRWKIAQKSNLSNIDFCWIPAPQESSLSFYPLKTVGIYRLMKDYWHNLVFALSTLIQPRGPVISVKYANFWNRSAVTRGGRWTSSRLGTRFRVHVVWFPI